MGMTSAMKLQRVVRNTRRVLAIELLCAARALDCLKPLRSSPPLEAVRASLAAVCPAWKTDQPFYAAIEAAARWIEDGKAVGEALAAVNPL